MSPNLDIKNQSICNSKHINDKDESRKCQTCTVCSYLSLNNKTTALKCSLPSKLGYDTMQETMVSYDLSTLHVCKSAF